MDKKHSRSLSGSIDNTDGHSSEELTIASPAEFVQRFGGNRVIKKVYTNTIHTNSISTSYTISCIVRVCKYTLECYR